MPIAFYIVKTEYVDYLRSFPSLARVFDNKEREGLSVRKYIGVVLFVGSYQYYAPVSSPKPSDYRNRKLQKGYQKKHYPNNPHCVGWQGQGAGA